MSEQPPSPADDELRIEALTPPDSRVRATPQPRRGPRLLAGWGALLLLLALLLARGAPQALALVRAEVAALTAPRADVRHIVPARVATPIVPYPTPTLPATLGAAVGPAPDNCPLGPAPTALPGILGMGIGAAPLWVIGYSGPHAALHLGDLPATAATRYGWQVHLALEVVPNYRSPITVRAFNLSDGSPLWLQVGGDAAPQVARVLITDVPGRVFVPNIWNEWLATLFVPAAGCFVLAANWPGGSWRVAFTAGR